MTVTAEFVTDCPKWKGDARLYQLSEPVDTYVGTTEYVVVSAVDVPYSGPETYVFAASKDGEATSWSELDGSFEGALDHDRALDGFLAYTNGEKS